jgi:hypothetical protein
MADRQFTNADLAACAKREVCLRRSAYPRWIQKGAMTQTKADREIEKMLEIQAHFEALATADEDRDKPKLI